MAAHSASHAGGYTPFEQPDVSVASDGSLASIHEASRVTIVELPSAAAFAEIGVDPEALASEVAWVGAPPRLLVLSRYAAHSTVHLLDPYGPRTIAEIRMEAPMRLFATVGAAALVVGSIGAAVLAATESHLTLYNFPTRTVPVVAGAAAGQFVVALSGSIEEWDPQSRMPRRRLRLPRAAAITAVGGSERVVWMTTAQEPARIEVIPLVNRGQPKAHELPEPIARVASHPRSDLVACVGAETGRLYVVDLDGRTRMRVIGPEGMDRIESVGLVVGRMTAVLAAQARRPIAVVPLDGRELDGDPAGAAAPIGILPRSAPAKRSTLTDEPDEHIDREEPGGSSAPETTDADPPDPSEQSPASMSSLFRHPMISSPISSPVPPQVSSQVPSQVASHIAPMTAPPPGRPASLVSERFSAWRDLVRQTQPREPSDPTEELPTRDPASPKGTQSAAAAAGPPVVRSDGLKSWRDEVVAWSRAVIAGATEHHAPAAPAIEALLARFELALSLHPVLVLLYGTHLCGERGAAPVDVARLLGRQWDEALGRGELAQRGVAGYAGSRVALSPAILRVLDELAPLTGTLVGVPGAAALLGPCVVVAGDEPLTVVAERYLSRVGGAILAAHGEPDRAELLLEARAHGAAPMLRPAAALDAAPTDPAIFVVSDAELADRLGVPHLV